MSNRRKIREMAMQALFLWDTQGARDPDAASQLMHDATDDPVLREFARRMADGAWEQKETIDAWVERLAPQWPPRRQPAVDRNILRLGVWELTNTQTPPKVVIDEFIELAKAYSTENSGAFVNGVLDSVLREHQRLTSATLPGEAVGPVSTPHPGAAPGPLIIDRTEQPPASEPAAEVPEPGSHPETAPLQFERPDTAPPDSDDAPTDR